jgi:hypothetical protein
LLLVRKRCALDGVAAEVHSAMEDKRKFVALIAGILGMLCVSAWSAHRIGMEVLTTFSIVFVTLAGFVGSCIGFCIGCLVCCIVYPLEKEEWEETAYREYRVRLLTNELGMAIIPSTAVGYTLVIVPLYGWPIVALAAIVYIWRFHRVHVQDRPTWLDSLRIVVWRKR